MFLIKVVLVAAFGSFLGTYFANKDNSKHNVK